MPPPHLLISGAGWSGTLLARLLQPYSARLTTRLLRTPPPADNATYIDRTLLTRVLDRAGLPQSTVDQIAVSRATDAGTTAPATEELVDARGRKVPISAQAFARVLNPSDAAMEGRERVVAVQARQGGVDVDVEMDGTSRETISPTLHIIAEGVHSASRNSLLPSNFTIHPIVAYQGKRKIPLAEFAREMRPLFGDGTVIRYVRSGIRVEVKYDVRGESAYTSWIYSRGARGEGDELHRPHRANSEASNIPSALYTELETFAPPTSIFGAYFLAEKVRQDRILHWLMRSLRLREADVRLLADRGVIFMGDAGHAMPILGSRGAESAVGDVVAFVDAVREGEVGSSEWLEGVVRRYYDSRWPVWSAEMDEAEARLAEMHGDGEAGGRSLI